MLTWRQLSALFAQMELDLVDSLKRSLMRDQPKGKLHWLTWQKLKLRALSRFRRDNRGIIKNYLDVISAETDELLRDQFADGAAETEADYKDTISQTLPENPDPSSDQPITRIPDQSFFGVNERRMNALLEDTQQLEQTASSAALRMMDDVYRQTLHKAEIAMAGGATTLPKAIDMAVQDFLSAGITCIEYKDGRRVNIADYTEMALRTAATRAKLQGDAAMRAQLGVDTVLVSQYGQCSDTCLPWQGRVYIDDVFGTFSGSRVGDRGLSRNGQWYPLLSVAVAAGLFHPNCRHTLTTWYEGVSTVPTPMDPAQICKAAALEQQQRALERKLRKAKRMEIGLTDPAQIRTYSEKRKTAQKELREFVSAHRELRRDPWKEKIHGIGIDNSSKKNIMIADIKRESGIRGELHLSPTPIDAENLSFDFTHTNKERMHNVTESEAKYIIQDANFSVSVWDGKFERYYAEKRNGLCRYARPVDTNRI